MSELNINQMEVETSSLLQNFGTEISSFINHLEAQADIAPLVMELIGIKRIQESKHVQKFIKDNNIEKGEDEELLVPPDKIKGFLRLIDVVETTKIAYDLLPINFVVSFISQYDAYLGNLIRTMFVSRPELLNSCDKNILFSELVKFGSMDEAKEFIIEKEVESVLRESHLKQFKWLENKLDITLRKDLPSFSDFIEITERRNLFVHCNGVVSRQYLEVCRENGVKGIDDVKVGEKLAAQPDYFNKCYEILFEIGVKLGQVIWRKLNPDDLYNADIHLNEVCFQLLIKGHYDLALNLLTFATDTLKKHHDQEIVCVFMINKALAHYLADRKEECIKVLNKYDWSATGDKFKLAVNTLREEYKISLELMKSIGANHQHLNKNAYRDWPLFRHLRKREDFQETYKEIFGEEFIYVESKPKSLEDILSEIKQIKPKVKKQKITEKDIS